MNLLPSYTSLIRDYFADKPVKRAHLFGSYSRNEGVQGKSDIDLLLELDHSSPIGMKFFLYQQELEDLLQQKVDLLSTGGISKYVQPFIDHDKVLIYER